MLGGGVARGMEGNLIHQTYEMEGQIAGNTTGFSMLVIDEESGIWRVGDTTNNSSPTNQELT